eukprot:gene2675-2845_t
MSEVQDQVEKILSDDLDKQLDGLKYLNKYLADRDQKANDVILDTGVPKTAFNIIRTNDVNHPELLYAAVILVLRISGGSQEETEFVEAADLISSIYKILDSTYNEEWNYRIKDRICLIVGNIIGNSLTSRDFILYTYNGFHHIFSHLSDYANVIDEINEEITKRNEFLKDNNMNIEDIDRNDQRFPKDIKIISDKLEYIQTLLWILSNCYGWSPSPTFHEDENYPFFDHISSLWCIEDVEISREIGCLLCKIAEVNSIEVIMSYPKIPRQMEYLLRTSTKDTVLIPVMSLYLSVSCGTDELVEILIEHDFFTLVTNLARKVSLEPVIQRIVANIVSNVLLGTPEQRFALLHSSVMRLVISILLTSPSKPARRYSVTVMRQLIAEEDLPRAKILPKPLSQVSVATQDQVRYLILRAISHLRDTGYPATALDMIKELKNHERIFPFFS